jgi:hypothetical protein
MTRERAALLGVQLLLGPAVLGSYTYGFAYWPESVGRMWGGVPEPLRGLYTAWMFVAAAGYFAFTPALFLYAPRRGVLGLPLAALYAAVLLGSALWMPLTHAHLAGRVPFSLVVLDLWVVACGSLALLACAGRAQLPAPWRTLAPLGAFCFCLQTVLLDAIVWPLLW